MKNTFGHSYSVIIFGESHGKAIGYVTDGFAPGIKLDMDFIASAIEGRKAKDGVSIQRKETDELHIISGYLSDHTTGILLTILIEDTNTRSRDYEKAKYRLHPSHANYIVNEKYMDWQDYRGGGHFGGRITAPPVVAGTIAMQVLEEEGILVRNHVQKSRTIEDIPFPENIEELQKQVRRINTMNFAVLDDIAAADMKAAMEEAANKGDSMGGILESCILNVSAGLGEPFFDSLESTLSHLLLGVPAVRGIESGLDFDFSDVYGSEANDPITYDKGFHTATNNNGGINGGISSGMPIRIHTAIKPTASIYKEQNTVDLKTHEVAKLQIQGRHGPTVIHRVRIVVDSVLAVDILDRPMERSATLTMR